MGVTPTGPLLSVALGGTKKTPAPLNADQRGTYTPDVSSVGTKFPQLKCHFWGVGSFSQDGPTPRSRCGKDALSSSLTRLAELGVGAWRNNSSLIIVPCVSVILQVGDGGDGLAH